jgi:hypothetical protein
MEYKQNTKFQTLTGMFASFSATDLEPAASNLFGKDFWIYVSTLASRCSSGHSAV